MHANNLHQGRYDFARLIAQLPELAEFAAPNPWGELSIDFADANAVRALNKALLQTEYGISHWDLPAGYLCPPVPGRADYLHGLAALLAQDKAALVTSNVRVLDVGVGANCIYPLIGQAMFGWQFVGSDVDAKALAIAQNNVDANGLNQQISLRMQANRGQIFAGVVTAEDRFTLTMCNPPFHASEKDAVLARQKKWAGLGTGDQGLYFGGYDKELWCTGGEASFIKRMIRESVPLAAQVRWFSTLVAKSEHLPDVYKQLKKAGAQAVHTEPMAQGKKQTRFVAWRFQN